MTRVPIVYENAEIIIINKATGVSVQGGAGVSHPLDKELPKQLGFPIYLVHRLDKDTAGLMLVAKSSAAAAKWSALISGGGVTKEYDALCVGRFDKKSGTMSNDVVQHGESKRAVTKYEVIGECTIPTNDGVGNALGGSATSDSNALGDIALSLVHLTLETGRMHQIRIHLAKLGNPIAGDDKHGNFRANKLLKKNCGVKTLLLASTKLTLPLDGKPRAFSAELPAAMQSVIDRLDLRFVN